MNTPFSRPRIPRPSPTRGAEQDAEDDGRITLGWTLSVITATALERSSSG